jgi:hypothetical protein
MMLKPFTIIPKIKHEFIIFIVITILLGHIGIIVAMFARDIDITFINFLTYQMNNGVFFNMAIAFLVGGIFPVLIDFANNFDNHFRGLKMSTVAIAILFIIYCVAFLASPVNSIIKQSMIVQFIMYLVSLIIAIYLFLLTYIDEFRETFNMLDDRKRNELASRPISPIIDDRGIQA